MHKLCCTTATALVSLSLSLLCLALYYASDRIYRDRKTVSRRVSKEKREASIYSVQTSPWKCNAKSCKSVGYYIRKPPKEEPEIIKENSIFFQRFSVCDCVQVCAALRRRKKPRLYNYTQCFIIRKSRSVYVHIYYSPCGPLYRKDRKRRRALCLRRRRSARQTATLYARPKRDPIT